MSKIIVLPALILGSISLTACSGNGFIGNNSAQNCNPAAYNCAAGAHGANRYADYGQYGGAAYGQHGGGTQGFGHNINGFGHYGGGAQSFGHYSGGAQSYGQNINGFGQYRAASAPKSRYGTFAELGGYQEYSYAHSYGAPYTPPAYVHQSYMPQAHMQIPALRTTPSHQFAPSYQFSSSVTAPPANCPAGTTAQTDGTCLQGSSYTAETSYSTAPTYSAASTYSTVPTYSSTTSYSTAVTASPLNCPAGTTAQSDGSCLQTSSNYVFSDSSYSSSSASYTPSSSNTSYSTTSHNTVNDSGMRQVPPPISEYNWGNSSTAYGLSGYVSPGTRTVEAPYSPAPYSPAPIADSTYQSPTSFSYEPIRK